MYTTYPTKKVATTTTTATLRRCDREAVDTGRVKIWVPGGS